MRHLCNCAAGQCTGKLHAPFLLLVLVRFSASDQAFSFKILILTKTRFSTVIFSCEKKRFLKLNAERLILALIEPSVNFWSLTFKPSWCCHVQPESAHFFAKSTRKRLRHTVVHRTSSKTAPMEGATKFHWKVAPRDHPMVPLHCHEIDAGHIKRRTSMCLQHPTSPRV